MGADLSRVRFDPLRDFAGVVLQQGRAAARRRLQRARRDPRPAPAGGDRRPHVVRPRPRPRRRRRGCPARRPTGSASHRDGGELTIGRGRMYVDGLLAENHGVRRPTFDPLLAEADRHRTTRPTSTSPTGRRPTPCPTAAPTSPTSTSGSARSPRRGPDLVEIAVGVDTTARTQTVWQVRLLPTHRRRGQLRDRRRRHPRLGGRDRAVGRPADGRHDRGRPSETTRATLPPTGGYRGLENQTYRVEIHDGGAPGTATFKWSRENGSVANRSSRWSSRRRCGSPRSAGTTCCASTTGDWVEIIDDNAELDQTAGRDAQGHRRRRRRPIITFAGALPADLQPADADDAAARHLRVRRWDQSGVVKSAAGRPARRPRRPGRDRADHRAGDRGHAGRARARHRRLVLAWRRPTARSAPATTGSSPRAPPTPRSRSSIAAPPLGIHHHYARLGVVTFPDPGPTAAGCGRRFAPATASPATARCASTPRVHASGS